MSQFNQTVLCQFYLCLLIIFGVGFSPDLTTAHAQTSELSVLFTDGFGGRFQSDAHYLGLDAYEEAIRQQRAQAGDDRVVTVSLGNTVGPFYLSRMDNGQSMITAMASLGYDAMVPGNYEFEYGTDFFTSTDTTGGDGQLHFVCANLLKPDNTPFLSPYRIFERNGIKIAVVGIMDVEMRKAILSENFTIPTGELKLVDPTPVLKELIPKVRAEADLIILISNFLFVPNLQIANQVTGIDVIVSKQGKQIDTEYVNLIKPRGEEEEFEFGHTYIFTPDDGVVEQVDLERFGDAGSQIGGFRFARFHYTVALAPAKSSPTLAGIAQKLEARFKDYCQQRFQREPDGDLISLSPETNNHDLGRFVVYVMMRRTRSELGVIHQGHFDFSYWDEVKTDGKLTIRESFLLMPENQALQQLLLTGKILRQLSAEERKMRNTGNSVYFLSVEPVFKGGEIQWLVHGLPIRDDELYSVSTVSLLTNEGTVFQDISKGTDIKSIFDGETRIIRDVLIDYLLDTSSSQALPIGEQLATESYLQRAMWRFTIDDASAMLNLSRLGNTETYPKVTIPEFRKSEVTSLRVGGKLKVTRESPSLLWDTVYDTTLGAAKIGEDPFREDNDDLQAYTVFVLRFLHLIGLSPTVGIGLDTEYLNNEVQDKKTGETIDVPRQLDLNIRTGVALPNVWRLSRSRLTYRRIVDLNSGDAKRAGLNALDLTTQLAMPVGQLRWMTTLNGTYFLPDDTANSERRQLLVNAKSQLNIPLVDNLAFAPVFETVLFKGQDESTIAGEYVFSFRLSYFKDWKWQYLSFFGAE